ncbi:MAG: PfkB family carbohydrate kinase [Chloroflexota bacterium]|nr:PfkB family carbohydrate kinase [Chloroflexota bacterium]
MPQARQDNREVVSPDYLIIGHVCKDLKPGGFAVGGTATYSSLTARNLGERVGVVTSAAPDFPPQGTLSGIEVLRLPSADTTVFENIYLDGTRHQVIHAVAQPISSTSIPLSWRRSRIVHLGPVAQEVSGDLVEGWGDALVALTPQGWMRQWDDDGRISPCRWKGAEQLLQTAEVLILSQEDVGGDWDRIEELARWAEIMVVTSGWQGSTVFHGGERRHFPARPVEEVEPTGAGDIFAAAYLIRLEETGDPWESAQFANCVASFSVEKAGLAGIPTPEQIASCRAKHERSGSCPLLVEMPWRNTWPPCSKPR